MSKLLITALIVLAVFVGGQGPAQAEDYRLGPGDVLSVGVWGYEDMAIKELVVRPDGKVAFPLAGELTAAGLSPAQFTVALTQKLSEYIKDPKVAVNIVKFRTTRVYVLGEVNKPGMYEIDRQHKLLDAIGMAGGYTRYAAKKAVFLIHNGQSASPIRINLQKLLKEGDMSQNYALTEGDVVFLSDNGKLDFARDVLPFLTGTYYITHFDEK